MANPMIPQGTLNRLRASINFVGNTALNVTAAFLGKEGINFSFDGEQTLMIPTNTGAVTSPEPYQMVTVSAHLLRSQALSSAFYSQIQNTTVVGDFIVTPDASTFPQLYVNNGAIKTSAAMLMNGTQADFTVELTGYIIINNALWNF